MCVSPFMSRVADFFLSKQKPNSFLILVVSSVIIDSLSLLSLVVQVITFNKVNLAVHKQSP